MKIPAQVLPYFVLFLLAGLCIFACNSDEPEADPKTENPSDTITVADLDRFSDHLQFLGATKKPGNIPRAPASSDLKMSFKDTLFLTDEVKIPFKFLHNAATNVAGVYVQVISTVGAGGSATFFYDVPELPETADDDSVSVILVGIDPAVVDLAGVPPAGGGPFTFDVTISPYNESGKPLDETQVVVSVPTSSDGTGSCGLVLPAGEYWDWEMSYVTDPDNPQGVASVMQPGYEFGGQFIKGCCYDGVSSYSSSCLNDTTSLRRLYFPTHYKRYFEEIVFFNNGTFQRNTLETLSNPDPLTSDFCGSGEGVVAASLRDVYYNGDWTLEPSPLLGGKYNQLTLLVKAKTGGVGFNNNGGIVQHLTCKSFRLVQIDREGGGRDVHSFYGRASPEGKWHSLS